MLREARVLKSAVEIHSSPLKLRDLVPPNEIEERTDKDRSLGIVPVSWIASEKDICVISCKFLK